MKIQNIVIEWAEVKKAFTDAIEDGKMLKGSQPINEKLRQWHNNPTRKDSWEGGSAHQTMQNIRNGYRTEAFAHSAEYAILSERRHWTYNEEEGEIDVDRVMSGYDEIFLDREVRESRPGIRLMIEFSFSWTTSAECIAQYGAWVASLITSLESTGYDLVVDVWINLDNLFQGQSYDQRTNVLIRVKQENEQSNFTDWSALFGPTGYRQLGFLAKCLAGQKIGRKVTHSFGHTVGGKDWGVKYDRDTATVQVFVNQRAGNDRLPVDKLNDDAIKEGLIPQPIRVTGAQSKKGSGGKGDHGF